MPASSQHDDGDGDEVLDLESPDTNATEIEDDGNTPDPVDTAPAADADDDAGDAPAPAAPQRIPKARFDEVNTEKNRLAAENETLLALVAELGGAATATAAAAAAAPAATAEPEFDVRAKMKAQMEALSTGDDELALSLAMEIEEHRIAVATRAAVQQVEKSNQAMSERQQQEALQATGAEVKADYPQLDPKSELVDRTACEFVITKRDSLMREGVPANQALRQAADLVAGMMGFSKTGAKPTDPPTVSASTARTIAARTAAATAAAAQPPQLSGLGARASKPAQDNAEDMTDAEFAALPEAEKARRRGDI